MSKKRLVVLIGLVLLVMVIVVFSAGIKRKSSGDGSSDSVNVTPKNIRQVTSVTAVDDLTDMVYAKSKDNYYIASFDEGKIYTLNAKSMTIEGEIPLAGVNKLLLDEDHQRLFVAGVNELAEVNLIDFSKARTVKVGDKPSEMQMSANGEYLFVVNEFSNDVAVVELKSFSVFKRIPVGRRPVDLALGVGDELLYVANKDSGTLSKISTRNLSLVGDIGDLGRPVVVERYPNSNELIVLDQYHDEMVVIDLITDKIVRRIKVVDYPAAVAFDVKRKRVFVSSFTQSSIGVVGNDEDMTKVMQLGTAFEPIAGLNNMIYDNKLSSLVITNTNTGKVFVVPVD